MSDQREIISSAPSKPQTMEYQGAQALVDGLAHYTIQNLTIHNHGSLTILSDKPAMHGKSYACGEARQSNFHGCSDEGEGSLDWQSAHIKVKNNLEGFIHKFTLRHEIGANVQTETWWDINAGSTTSAWATDFKSWTRDRWQIEIQLEYQGPVFKNDGWKQCNLYDKDNAGNGPLEFKIEKSEINFDLRSGPCSTSFLNSDVYNGFAFLKVENNFHVPTSYSAVNHTPTGKPPQFKLWDEITQPNQATSSKPVYYITGDIDHPDDAWDIKVLRQGDKKPHANRTKGKGCMLKSCDQSCSISIAVNDSQWTTKFPSGDCTDSWEDGPWDSSLDGVKSVDGEWTTDM